MILQHFLITRFNLKQDAWFKTKHSRDININGDWLENRFSLFEKFCLPSVAHQSCKNFVWLVYFDVDTPPLYKGRILEITKAFPFFVPRYLTGMNFLISDIRKQIQLSHPGLVITSRLDNDDSLHKDYVSSIQNLVISRGIRHGLIDIPFGYCLQRNPEFKFRKSVQFSNAFLSMVESFAPEVEFATVFSRPHPALAFTMPTYMILFKPLWLQFIHTENVLNTVQGFPVKVPDLNIDFGIKEFEDNQTLQDPKLNSPLAIVQALFYGLKKVCKYCLLRLRIFRFNS